MSHWDVIVVGAGPAGLMAAGRAGGRGRQTLLLERNRRCGAKVLLSGGTRCNLTHATDRRGIVEAFGAEGQFLHSALAALGPEEVVDWFRARGVPTKVEPGGKVFPCSDRAEDVLAALVAPLKEAAVELALDELLVEIARAADGFRLTTARRELHAERIVLASGGRSYPASGSTGDGYRWAAALGHTIVAPRPALVPITTHAAWVRQLQGVTLSDVLVQVVEPDGEAGPLCLAQRRESLLFTHFGVSGPAALDVSRAVSGHPQPATLLLHCDLLPDINRDEFEAALQAECLAAGKRLAASILSRWLPQRLADTILRQTDADPQRRAAELSRPERQRLVQAIKQLEIPISGTMGFRKAEVTAGGVALEEVDSRNMQSRLVPGFFFAGEVLDFDGPIGGYNFQAAFSTGWLAGECV
jgi:predicted Rossmann fold flavoprotein